MIQKPGTRQQFISSFRLSLFLLFSSPKETAFEKGSILIWLNKTTGSSVCNTGLLRSLRVFCVASGFSMQPAENLNICVTFDDDGLDGDAEGSLEQAEAADPDQQVVDRRRQLRITPWGFIKFSQ